jgi:hypothetical protein
VLNQPKTVEIPLLNQLLSPQTGQLSKTHPRFACAHMYSPHTYYLVWLVYKGFRVVQGRSAGGLGWSNESPTTGQKKACITDALSVLLTPKNTVIIGLFSVKSRIGTMLGTALGDFGLLRTWRASDAENLPI